jgi:co-chaperonin GroES (HSP10)
MYRPTRKHIFIKPHEVEKVGRIFLPQLGLASTAPISGEVLAVGEEVEELQKGDTVYFPQGTGLKHYINGESILLMDEDHVIAKE